MSQRLLDRSHALFGAKIVSSHAFHGDETIVVEGDDIHEVLSTLRSDAEAKLDFLVDLTAVDHYGREPRFEVVYHLRSMATGERLRVEAEVADTDDGTEPYIATVCDLWKSANWMERDDLLTALADLGYRVTVLDDQPGGLNGPSILLCAER